MTDNDFAPSAAHGAVAPASPSSDQIVLWGVNDDASCKCSLGHACPLKNRGKHPKWAPYEPDDNLGNLTGAEHDRIVIDVDVRTGDGFAELRTLPGFDAADLERTYAVATASGGAHFYFRHPGPRVGNGKLATSTPNIDVRGDKREGDGWAYVVAPESRIVRDDGTVDTHQPYEGCPTELAPCPDWLLAALLIRGSTKEKGEPVRAIDETHPDWDRRVDMAIEACKTMPESKGDGEASKCLVRLAARLVIELQLPIAHACELIETFFNPRCTNTDGAPWPWKEKDIVRALERAAQQDDPMRRVAPAEFSEMIKARTTPAPLRSVDLSVPTTTTRKRHDPAHAYTIEVGALAAHPSAGKKPFNELIALFTRGDGWDGCWQYDDFGEYARCVNPPLRLDAETCGVTATDLQALRSYLEHIGIIATDRDIGAAVTQASRALRYHPVREYFASLPKGEPAIFNGIAKRLFGTDETLADTFLEKFMVSAVRRVLNPGCQVDTVFVLVGEEQGEGKSQCVQALFRPEWTRLGLPAKSLADRDAAHALIGFWAVELGELVSLVKSSVQESKDYLSKPFDDYRAFGTGERVRRMRQNVFFGTTNDQQFLRDYANRRFWPVQIPKGHEIPLAWVREHRDALWAAAVELAKDERYRHWFDRDEEREIEKYRQRFLELDAWYDIVLSYCRGREFVQVEDLWTKALNGEAKALDNRTRARIVDTLKKLGCREGKEPIARVRGEADKRRRGWRVPADIAAEELAPRAAVAFIKKAG